LRERETRTISLDVRKKIKQNMERKKKNGRRRRDGVYIRAMCETRSRPSPVGIANDF
jgi:hypothetical protein